MKRRYLFFAAGSVLIALVVWGLGSLMTGPEGRRGVAAGAIAGCAFQLLMFAVTSVALPGNRMLAHGVGMLGRLALVIAAALALVPASGLPQAPTLFTLVTVLFASTLLEPVAHAAGAPNEETTRIDDRGR